MTVKKSVRPIFIITVDTEEEWDWNGQFPQSPFSTDNIRLIPKFQKFCKQLDVTPTYFVDYAVAEKKENRDVLNHYFTRNECDIGAHMHPWCTPPVKETLSDRNSHSINIGVDLFAQKMSSLTLLLNNAFNCHPFSFRSGRWGLNGTLLKVLVEQGYKVDSSVRPFYQDSDFSYQNAGTKPYWPSYHDILKADKQREILEIPVTSGYNYPCFELMNKWHSRLSRKPFSKLRLIGILSRLQIMRKIALTPEAQNYQDMCRCIDMYVQRGDRAFNLFFHSSDLMPGNTVYVRSAKEESEFYEKIKRSILHARKEHDAEFLTIRQAYERLKGSC